MTESPRHVELVEALLAKTVEGKVDWQATADESRFISALKGRLTFEVLRTELGPGHYVPDVTVVLTARDKDARPFIEIREDGVESRLHELFEVARGRALRVDERLDESLELLKSL